jgi:S1-C subfamily serine protease
MARAVMQQLIDNGEVRRGYLGVAVQGLNVELAEAFGVDLREGVVVVEVEPGGISERAGLQAGDIITRMSGRQINKISDFHSQAAITFVGDRVEMAVLRNGRAKRLRLDVDDTAQANVRGARLDARLEGVTLQNFRDRDEPDLSAGVLVTDVEEGSRIWNYGIRAGDIIVAANRRNVRNISAMRPGRVTSCCCGCIATASSGTWPSASEALF